MRGGAAILAVTASLLAGPAPAAGFEPPTGWNGENPFDCELQQAGFGPTGPDPDADPYCVEFDKRRQNVAELGVVDFLAQEPARVAAASDRCFYYQVDHWRGSVVQDDGSTKTYEWDGRYFFDKARGEGGVWVTNFNFNGRTEDPGRIPGMPPEWNRHFGPGTGGFVTRNGIQGEPRCIELAARSSPYAADPAAARACLAATSAMSSRSIGGIRLGDREARVRARLGAPHLVRRGFLRWCYRDGTSLRVGHAADRSGSGGASAGEPALLLLTTSPAYRTRRIGPSSSARAFRRAFRGAVRRYTVNGRVVWSLSRRSRMLAGVRHGRVHYLAVYDDRRLRSLRAVRSFLRRSG